MKRLLLLLIIVFVAATIASAAPAPSAKVPVVSLYAFACPGCAFPTNIADCVSQGGAIQKINPDGSVLCLVPAGAKQTCMMLIGADNGSALADADIGPQGGQCFIPSDSTIIEVTIKADAGTPTALPRKEHGASNTNLLSGALSTASAGAVACSNVAGSMGLDGVTTCSATLTSTALLAGDWLGLTSGTAGGTAKRVSVAVTYTTP